MTGAILAAFFVWSIVMTVRWRNQRNEERE